MTFQELFEKNKALIIDENKKLTPFGVMLFVSIAVRLTPIYIKAWLDSFKR